MENNLQFVIYSKPKCPACKMSKAHFDRNNIPYSDNYYGDKNKTNVIDIENENEEKRNWSIKKVNKIKNKYKITSMPIIKVIDKENNVLDVFGGFNVQKLNEWFEKY